MIRLAICPIRHLIQFVLFWLGNTKLFYLCLVTGDIHLTGHIDRETQDTWNFRLRASDGKYNASSSIHVTILDFNDNTPYFLDDFYTFNVTENQYNHTQIGQISANDTDAGPNSNLTYSITEGNINNHFSIDPFKVKQNYEAKVLNLLKKNRHKEFMQSWFYDHLVLTLRIMTAYHEYIKHTILNFICYNTIQFFLTINVNLL